MLLLIFIIVGLLQLSLSILALRANIKATQQETHPPIWNYFGIWRGAIGCALAMISFYFCYTYNGPTASYIVHGFPFLAYLIDQNGRDYTGFFTAPALILNPIIWALFPQILFWLWRRKMPTLRSGPIQEDIQSQHRS